MERALDKFGDVEGKVLQLMASNSDTSFSFQGIKRSLQLHQEKLSRGLSRLTALGLIGKREDGYLITKKGLRAIGQSCPAPVTVVGESYLPADSDPSVIANALKGRWFSGMRWLGFSSNRNGVDLKWVTDEGDIQVQASFSGSKFEVSLISFPPNEEERAKEVASRLFVKIINTIYGRKAEAIN
ncbi:MAG: hypothetical protein NO516_03180 [Candidatus Methanomethylicia archaeon]|nr:hypothetical protein [Candidatus Methanomethylicia archaeon]